MAQSGATAEHGVWSLEEIPVMKKISLVLILCFCERLFPTVSLDHLFYFLGKSYTAFFFGNKRKKWGFRTEKNDMNAGITSSHDSNTHSSILLNV